MTANGSKRLAGPGLEKADGLVEQAAASPEIIRLCGKQA